MRAPRFILFATLTVAVVSLSSIRADVSLAPLFQDHMVLQREKPIAVWGWAQPQEEVVVTLGPVSAKTTANDRGEWRASLPAQSANAQPGTLVVKGRNTITVQDVLIGEVWLCSGQSNMGFRLGNDLHAATVIPVSTQPLLRQFRVEQTVGATPQTQVKGQWVLASPDTVGEFTAVGYYFGHDLQRTLGVPVGLINSTWGGTPVEAWTPPDALAKNQTFQPVLTRWQEILDKYPEAKKTYDARLAKWEKDSADAKAQNKKFTARKPGPPMGPGHQRTPGVLYNGMIHPLAPYTLRGALWYQAEGNAVFANEYHAIFAAMITSWREQFAQGDVPFYWVQLPNFKNPIDKTGENWAVLREQQTRTLSLPNTAQAITIDVGNPDDIHPTNKAPVGDRLLRLALDHIYGRPQVTSGPKMVWTKFTAGGAHVKFDAGDGGKLIAAHQPLESFELAGADHVFHPAIATLDGNTVQVHADAVPAPVAVRYAWKNNPTSSLKNSTDLPAAPFRSDDW